MARWEERMLDQAREMPRPAARPPAPQRQGALGYSVEGSGCCAQTSTTAAVAIFSELAVATFRPPVAALPPPERAAGAFRPPVAAFRSPAPAAEVLHAEDITGARAWHGTLCKKDADGLDTQHADSSRRRVSCRA